MTASASPPESTDLQRDAVFDGSRRYRYLLTRRWAPGGSTVAFVLLNPSTADATRDDPTIRRCMGFARGWGHAALSVVNLFAYRATLPVELRRARAPVGPRNNAWLLRAARDAERVVLAWGIHGAWEGRERAVLELLAPLNGRLSCLGRTQGGHPRHVLYLRGDTPPRPWAP